MGEDGYFTHKYFSVSPDRLVLQEDSFQFKFVFTSLTSSNSADQHKHRSHRFRTCCVVFRHLLTLCFSSEARLYASVALIDALPSGSLYNWRPPPHPPREPHRWTAYRCPYVTALPWTIQTHQAPLLCTTTHCMTTQPGRRWSNPDAPACT